jgi:hypothetical protein
VQDLPYFKAFPSDWEQAMRRAEIPPADRGDVYRLIFFAWADGDLKWEDEAIMRRYAREMGWQWRRFSRTLEHYKRLCSPASRPRLPLFLLRNLKQSLPEVSPEFGPSLPEVSPKFDRSLTKVSPEFDQSLTEVSPEFDAQTRAKSFNHGGAHDMPESIVRSHSHGQKAEAEGDAAVGVAPFDNFTDELTAMAEAISTAIGLPSVPEGETAKPIHDAADEFIGAGVHPADVGAYEMDFYQRKAAQGSKYPLTLKILREDLRGWVRAKHMLQSATPTPAADNSRSAQRQQASARAKEILFGGGNKR